MAKIEMQAVRGSHRDGSTPGVDRRFTERDLHVYPELYPLALQYLENYTGTFETLLDAQNLLDATGSLPIPIAKMVLNCAYSDPSVSFQIDLGEPAKPAEINNVVDFPPRPPQPVRPYIRTPPEPEPKVRRGRLRLPAKVKAPFGMSSWNGKVLHRIRPHSSYLEWPFERDITDWRNGVDRDPLPTDKRGTPTLFVTWECGGGGRKSEPQLLFERPEGVPYCRAGCFSDICNRCGKMIHLDPNAAPSDPIGPCPRCDVPKQERPRRDAQGRFR